MTTHKNAKFHTTIATHLLFSIGILLSGNTFADRDIFTMPTYATVKQLLTEESGRKAADKIEASARQAADKNLQTTINNIALPPVHYIGEEYGGGIVFYVYDDGQHGLIAATADQNGGNPVRWYGGTNTNTRARADGVGAGKANTAIIIANQGSIDGAVFAATLCNEYSVTDADGVKYGDWYLPSYSELYLLRLQQNVVGGLANGIYWSSTEFDRSKAKIQRFSGMQNFPEVKSLLLNVRAIRAF